MASFHPTSRSRWPWEMSNPKYFTVCLPVWALFLDTRYPASPRKFGRSTVNSKHSSLESAATSRSSTYCNTIPFEFLFLLSSSFASWFPNIVWQHSLGTSSFLSSFQIFPLNSEQLLTTRVQWDIEKGILQINYTKPFSFSGKDVNSVYGFATTGCKS